jgi:NADPH:quinone reductase-like Zn-dependent oxidoreductase
MPHSHKERKPIAEGTEMLAVVHECYGSPEVLQVREIPAPIPKPGEILIRIRATSVTAAEALMRQGKPWFGRPVLGLTRPKRKVLGLELAGEVAGLGVGARGFTVGERVFGFTGFQCGGYAQYICVPDSASVIAMPANASFEAAAALVDGPTTALFFLRKASLKPSHRVLVYGASGSIGTAAVQLAANSGAEVTAVCGAANFALARFLGAQRVIDYRSEDFTREQEAYDIIFDTVGKIPFAKCKGSLRRDGRYLVTVMSAGAIAATLWTALGARKRAIFAMSIDKLGELREIREQVESGKHRPVIDRVYPLAAIREAHAYVDTGRKRGNVIIAMGHEG